MQLHVRRGLAATLVCTALLAHAACDDSSDDAGTSSSSAASPDDDTTSTDPTESTDPTDPTGTPPDGLTELPLTTDAQQPGTAPMWAFPVVVKGWTFTTRDQKGVNQLTRNGSDALFTSYQLKEAGSNSSDAADSKAWLVKYHAELSQNSQISKVSTPTYGTALLQTDHGTVEFVKQDLTYVTAAGVKYRSRFVARSLGTYLIAVQYGAPEGQWSESEWQRLISSGLKVVLGW
ncbi:hypothetical protein [Nocardioides sp. Root140]|uniref:hypothetical protein n=1 Tax=Nocardioides sp. Root140 TaxID=1736460 RepID=UPI0007001350|nr:hypothetical protein [Nocardioides sp. Root140]KQY63833.1 hypothetical protein ASD30_02290 [Nocardioides sp. Root140]